MQPHGKNFGTATFSERGKPLNHVQYAYKNGKVISNSI